MKNIFLTAIFTTTMINAAPVNLKSCMGCHGQNFEKSALGKSKVVSSMSEKEIETAMVGYKNGTYGGPMAGLMKGQVAKYSEAELKASAAEIKALAK